MTIKDPLLLYRELITPEFIDGLLRGAQVAPRAGIYTASIVLALMIGQRLSEDKTLEQAVASIRDRGDNDLLEEMASRSKRIKEGRISPSTGAYAIARKRLPLSVVTGVADSLNQSILAATKSVESSDNDVYVIDGTTIQVAHSPDNLAKYPLCGNQHGESHFPQVRVSVATQASTGVVMRPAIGAYAGKKTGELSLADEVLAQIPLGSTVIGDRLYGCYTFAHAASSRGLKVITRLKVGDAERLIGFTPRETGEKQHVWKPSKDLIRRHPALRATEVSGRLVWCPIVSPDGKGEMLVIFTTVDAQLAKVIELYGWRWVVELDLRSIKTTLKMNFINAKSPGVVKKEIILGVSAYNLICYVRGVIAANSNLNPRKLSFTSIARRIKNIATLAFHNRSQRDIAAAIDLLHNEGKSFQLPNRSKKRNSEPRKTWRRGQSRFFLKSREEERKTCLQQKVPVLESSMP